MDIEFDKWVAKGWGGEKWIVNGEKYCGKILYLIKGRKFSYHSHKIKEETFYIQKGRVKLSYFYYHSEAEKFINEHGADRFIQMCPYEILEVGDYFHILPNVVHSAEALLDSEVIEFSTQHFESDSYRLIKGD